jgi:hypothetical protein
MFETKKDDRVGFFLFCFFKKLISEMGMAHNKFFFFKKE